MEALKADNLPYSSIKNANSNKQKPIRTAYVKTGSKNPAFGASVHVNEGLGKKALNLGLNAVDKIQKHIETGGFIVEFLVVDFIGMVIPRTYQAYHRNEKELGHPNYAAAKEEFTREILSGPSMFLIPFAFLCASKKMFGSASHVKRDTLKKFRNITETAFKTDKNENLAHNFYKKIVDKLYDSKITDKAKEVIVDDFLNLHNAKPNEVKNLSKKVTGTLISTNKIIGNDKKLGISLEDSSIINLDGKAKNVGDFVEECRNYSSDVINSISAAGKNANEQLINQIHNFKEGARKLITTTAVGTMSAFLMYIPKLYNQNKQYPGLAGLTTNPSSKDQNEKKELKK